MFEQDFEHRKFGEGDYIFGHKYKQNFKLLLASYTKPTLSNDLRPCNYIDMAHGY